MFVHLYFIILSFSSIKDDIENCQRDTGRRAGKKPHRTGIRQTIFII